MKTVVYSFLESHDEAERLAIALCVDCIPIAVRTFPDGESLVRVPDHSTTALVYRSLDHPNEKLIELILAASALRDSGCEQIILIAPYLGYMRQDIAFNPGEAVSQRVIGSLIDAFFDGLVTVDPHLHRTASLSELLPGKITINVSAASTLAELLRLNVDRETLLVGPDSEARPWVENVAKPLGLEVIIGNKVRHGDRDITVDLPEIQRVAGRPVILIDDVISSGQTLIECAQLLFAAGATNVEAIATHCLASKEDLKRLHDNGICKIRTSDTISGPTAEAKIATAIADALKLHGLVTISANKQVQ